MASNSSSASARATSAQETALTSYDEVPHQSYAFAQTSPDLLQGIAHIFGLHAPSPSTARVLEIGCSIGNNIMGIAARYPKSKCVGIDYAAKQIELGLQNVKALGISNVELKHMSAMDITNEFGEFDYIITHGVFSWVPREVQEKILDVCNKNLSPNGVAYISYNTLPGWNSVRTVREMMMYHAAMYTTPEEKVLGAKQLLKFVGDSAKANNNTTLHTVIERESSILDNQPDYYLLHEHLEENNVQFYFHEFMAMAAQHNLQYLAETNVEKMFSGSFSADIAQVLATSTDIVRTEQYMDFIYDRRFHCTLLCHKDRILSRSLKALDILPGYVFNRFSSETDLSNDTVLTAGETVSFQAASGMTMGTNDALALAVLQALFAQPGACVPIKELIAQAHKKLKALKHPVANNAADAFEDMACQVLLRFVFTGGLYFYKEPVPYTAQLSKKPKTSHMARVHALQQGWTIGQRHEHVVLAPFDRMLVQLLDGTRDEDALVKGLLPAFERNELSMSDNGNAITDSKHIQERLPQFVREALARYATYGLLVA